MSLAYATNRSLIIPALLPHIGSKSHLKFGGRAGKGFTEGNSIAIGESKSVIDMNKTEFPSWSEVLDFDLLTKRTGVHVTDIWEFMRTEHANAIQNFTIDIQDMPTESSWIDFIDAFNLHFENKTVALIGSAFALTFIDDAFKTHDEDGFERIRRATLCFTPSNKILDLVRASIIHIPKHYVGVHIRYGDMYHLSSCSEAKAKEGFDKLLSNIRGANITKGSSVYIGSKDSNAKKCFGENSNFEYNVFASSDITSPSPEVDRSIDAYNITTTVPSLMSAMEAINLDVGTKYLLMDMMLVSLGHRVRSFTDLAFF